MKVAHRVRRKRQRHERVGKAPVELARGEHSDHGVLLGVEDHLLAHHRGIAAEVRAPEPLRQHHDLVVAALVLARHESPTERGTHAQDVEVRRAD
jgi:hypothetical protein